MIVLYGFAISRMHVAREGALEARTTSEPREHSLAAIANMNGSDPAHMAEAAPQAWQSRIVTVILEVQGARSVAKLASKLADISGVSSISAGDANVATD